MTKEQEIARFIEANIKSQPGISGARLGALATAQFPGINFRAQFNGFKSFVKQYCGPEVEISVAGPAGDDTYRWTATSSPSEKTGATIVPVPEVTESPWGAFAVTDSPSKLRLNRESGQLDVVAGSSEVLVEPWVEVPKVTTEEYQQLATQFLPQINDADRYHFTKLLHLPDFWDRWFTETRSFAGGKYFRAWISFRFFRLCEIFVERLKKLGVHDDLQPVILERLKQSKAVKKQLRTDEFVETPPGSSRLRQIALSAVRAMPDEDLRRMWLPLGVMSDALRRSNH